MRKYGLAIMLLIGASSIGQAQTTQQRSTATPTPPVPMSANQYSSEADAKRACGTDKVVWANLDSKVLHVSGDKNYGTTKKGAYMCENVATKDGMRLAK